VAVVRFFDGITFDCVGVPVPELELEELELDELELEEPEPGGGRHGGTISVVTLEFAGSTSWFCGCAPAAA
jgi:hypothetical protein